MNDVLIVGAGPTGLVLALWLTRQGVQVRIVDKSKGPGETSRAMAVQARTLELYRQLGLADDVVAAGYINPTLNLWARGKLVSSVHFANAGEDISPYPFILTYPQDQHERLLVDRLKTLGVEVERETEFLSFEEGDDHVVAALRRKDGTEEIVEARYLAGCDGARSPIRHEIGGDFEGGTYRQLFYVADVEISGLEPAGEVHIALDQSDFVAVLSYGDGKSRLIGTVRDERADRPEALTFEDDGHEAVESMHLRVDKVNWFSTYRVHHRVTDHFRRGRTFLLGDAAHVHSPAGGQGMNTGIADAINLAWKLAAVLKGRANDNLLDSYDAERRAFARTLVDTTDRLFTFVTAEGSFADFVRTRIAPFIASLAYKSENVREFAFRLISQTTLNYRESPLSMGKAGQVEGGDRLPWAPDDENYKPLSEITWQMHVYGEARQDLEDWCRDNAVPLQVFAWREEYEKAGFARDAAYLLRPDTYVALAEPHASVAEFSRYALTHGLTFR